MMKFKCQSIERSLLLVHCCLSRKIEDNVIILLIFSLGRDA